MSGSVQFSNYQWLVASLDTNNNGKMDELKAENHIKQQVDSDGNGEISRQELISALQADKVEIRQGQILQGRGFQIHVEGLETLKSVRSISQNGISSTHVWSPSFYSDDTSRDRYHKLAESNRSYSSSIDKMESALRSIVSITDGKTDATSRALNIQARTTLNSTRWSTWNARLQQSLSNTRPWFNDYTPGMRSQQSNGISSQQSSGRDPFAGGGNSIGSDPYGKDPFNGGGNSSDPYGKDPFNGGGRPSDPNQPVIPRDPYEDRLLPHIREQEMIFSNLQSSYEVMNNALKAIREQTNNLPDLQATVKSTDANIARAFANLSAIESSPKSAAQVAQNIRSSADATEAKATGRTAPFAGIGAGVGLVAGGAIGYFAGGQNLKSAAMGAGIGAAASAGIGALIGSGIDASYKGEASSLRALATQVESYQPAQDRQTVSQANQSFYGQLFEARNARDLDRARVVDNSISGINQQVQPVVQRSTTILDAYRKY